MVKRHYERVKILNYWTSHLGLLKNRLAKKKARNLCSAGIILLNEKNQILLQKRGDDGNWCIPGGSLEVGESVEAAAQREVYEETGLRVSKMELFNIYSGPSQHHIYPDGNEFFFVAAVFISSEYYGDIRIDGQESMDIRFFDIDNLPSNLTKSNLPMFTDLKARFGIDV